MNGPVNPNGKSSVITRWVLGNATLSIIPAVQNFFRFIPNPYFIANHPPLLFWSILTIAILANVAPIRQLGRHHLASDKPDFSDNLKLEKAGLGATLGLFFLPMVSVFWFGLYTFTVFASPLMTTFAYSEDMRVELKVESKSSRSKCRNELRFSGLGFWGKLCGVDQDVWSSVRECDRVAAIGIGNRFGMRIKSLELLPAVPTSSKSPEVVDC